MINDTKRRIEEAQAKLPGIKERIIAVGLMLAMSIAMVASTSYAWLTISRSPEAKGMTTTITGNGNLEIALVPKDGSVPMNADGSTSDLFATNITWGNLVNLSDQRYGLDQIALRPSLLSSYNLTSSPLYGATYGADGRVSGTSEKYSFASFATAEDGSTYFAATTPSDPNFGVRAITSITYENISGNAALNALQARITNAYGAAEQQYRNMIGTGDGSDSMVIYGEGATAVRAIPALQMLMELYVQEKAQNLLGSYTQNYNSVVTYTYYLMQGFQSVLVKEGEALTSLANMQIYKTDNAMGTGYYASFEEFAHDYNNKMLHPAVQLESLSTFFANYNAIEKVLKDNPDKTDDLYDLAMACDPATVAAADRPAVTWAQLSPHVNVLVNISKVTIQHGSSKVTIGTLSKGDAGALLNLAGDATQSNPATATIPSGALRDTEARLGAYLKSSGIVVSINVNYMGVGEVYSYVVTNVDSQALTISGKDQQTVENMVNAGGEDQGEAVANDTYGMAIDLWVRTNISDVVLTLEGNLNTVEVTATTVNKDGVETTLYQMTVSTETTGTAYGLTVDGVTTYYSYENGVVTEIGVAGTMLTMMGYSFKSNNTTKEIDGVTYDEYTMTQTQSTNTDVYVIEDVERWYLEDGTLVGAVETLNSDSRYTFTETAETTTVNGVAVTLYTMEYVDPASNDTMTAKAYKIPEDVWYNASNHEVLGTDAQLREDGAVFTVKTTEWVTGYDGVNRVWEDYLSMIENGFMLENNTTQGSGSCYVFYADPSEQTRILNLLEAFTVVFLDQNGNKLGTAKLDTEHYYSINGKTTVPLQLTAGTTYVDENGNQQYGIMPLNQNEATWVTAVIYLDGTRLTNSEVLAVGEIEGTLNLQFGSSVPLNNQDDPALRFEFRDLTAEAGYNGATSASSSQPIALEYDEDGHKVTVTLMVDGTQPSSIQGFFIRSISKTQGTKGKTEQFTYQGNGIWTAEFLLTTPGQYIMRSLIVDGAEYALDDGTENAENGVVVDSFPTVLIDGLGIASVSVSGLNKGITMTANDSVTAEVTVGIDADPSLMPSQVRALFRSSDGAEFTALLTNSGDSGFGATLWKGTATITQGGEYTLQYVVMDGVFFDLTEIWEKQAANDPEQGMFTYIIYLGLTTQVWTTGVPVENENGDLVNSTTFEFQGPQNIAFQVKIFDGSGQEVRALDDVWLYYHSEGSVLDQDGMYGQVYWNAATNQYEGVLQLTAGGSFVFDRVVTNRSNQNSISTIGRADFSPTITAIVTDPPVFAGSVIQNYQFVPNGGAEMRVNLSNAQTSTVWALIQDVTTGKLYMVKSQQYQSVGDYQQFPFTIPSVDNTNDNVDNPTQDGNWRMIALYMQGCADNNENWVPKTENPLGDAAWATLEDANGDGIWEIGGTTNTVDPVDYFIFDLTDTAVNNNGPIEAYVVQTVYVSVNGADEVSANKVTFGNVIFGATDTNGNKRIDAEEITAAFMQTHTYSPTGAPITFVITDWKGEPIQLATTVTWTSVYGHNPSDYGGYTTDYLFQNVNATLSQNGNTFTLAPQTYQQAGTHTTSFVISIDGKSIATIVGDTIAVYSKAPTVTISGVSANPTTARYYLTSTPNSLNVITGSFNNKIDDYNAVVYMYVAAQTGTLDQEQVAIKYPTVTLSIAGIPSAHGGVTMVFPSGNNTSSTFTFAAGKTTAASTIGAGTDGVFSEGILGIGASVEQWPVFYPAGKQTVQTVVVTYGDAQYTVTLSNAVTINNPQYPPYVSFKVNDSTFNSSNLPGRVYSTDGETVTLTLPSVSSWSYTQTDNVPGTETLTSDTTDDVYTATSASWGRSNYTYYKRNIKVYTSTGTSTSYLVTKEIVGWKVNGVEYKPGDTVTVTGTQTITAVVKTTNGAKTVQTTTVTRTVTTFTATGETSTGWSPTKGSKVTSVQNTETTTSTTN